MNESLKDFLMDTNNSLNDKIKEILKYKDLPDKNKIIQSIMCNNFNFCNENNIIKKNIVKEDIENILQDYKDIYNCEHYNCNVLIFTSCCNKIYPCRICHDLNENHKIDRYKIDTIICKNCNEIQDKSKNCIKCNIEFSSYYCEICCLYQTNENIDIYHCNKCNICRIGKKEQYIHCDNCNMCFNNDFIDNHQCTQHFKNNCGICMEEIFDSIKKTTALKCGHVLHIDCLNNYTKNDYKCPICKKSIYENMNPIWENIKNFNDLNPTPDEYKNWNVKIYCNDCEKYCNTLFQITSFHECNNCNSYNTQKVELIKNQNENNQENLQLSDIDSNSSDLNSLSDIDSNNSDLNLSSDEEN